MRVSSICWTRISDVTTFMSTGSPKCSCHSSDARSIGSNGSLDMSLSLVAGSLRLEWEDAARGLHSVPRKALES
jgi:hypothetical protein